MRAWYRFENKADDPTVAELFIYDEIGRSFWSDDTITAKQFVDELEALPEAVTKIVVRINSPGGDIFDATTITNALREQRVSKGRTVETIVDGLAASAASVVMMAGSKISIADNALVFVHNPHTIEVGDAAQMRKTAEALDKVRDTIVTTYQWQSKLSTEKIRALMDAETWMDADEAIANGFATEKIEGTESETVAAHFERRVLAKLTVPEKYRARVDRFLKPAATATPAAPAPRSGATPAAAADVLRLCRDAGLDLVFAGALLESQAPIDAVRASIDAEKQQRVQAAERARQIRALCATTKLPELADSYISGAMPVDAVRAQLTVLTAKLDNVEIDGWLPVDGQQPRRRASLSTSEIYAQRNRGEQR